VSAEWKNTFRVGKYRGRDDVPARQCRPLHSPGPAHADAAAIEEGAAVVPRRSTCTL
jgi:hypothetical protein